MTFPFLCPQGHLLEGEPDQVGQQVECPLCQTAFIVPSPDGGVPNDAGGPPAELPNVTGEAIAGATVNPFEPDATGPRMIHIPCPNGHELETPDEMIGQSALCPYCGAQFQLRYQDSIEAMRQRQEEQERKERKLANQWFQWAVIMAAVVVLGLIVLIAVSASTG